MFSSRLSWDLRQNAIAGLLVRKRLAGARIFDLTESNPTRAGFAYPPEMPAALADPRALLYDPAPAGLSSARELVAAMHGVETGRVLLTASTSEAYSWLFKLLADPGDEILAPRPSYPLFEYLAALESVVVRHYPLVYQEGWFIDIDALRSAIGPRARAVVVVNPNNPTGSYLKREESEDLAALARRHGFALISDEVFSSYSLSPGPDRVETLAHARDALTFCLGGLSKMAGLPQMKLGWIVAGGPPALRAQALDRLELIADTYLSIGAPVQHALPALLAAGTGIQRQILDRLRANLDLLRGAISGTGLRLLEVEGGWYATLRVPRVRGEEEWALGLLEDCDVLVQPGFFYDFASEAYLVLSLLTPREVFEEGVRRLLAFSRSV